MLVQWYANLEAEEAKVAPKMDELFRKSLQNTNGKFIGGPYHPQTADIMYLAEFDSSEEFQKAGKWFLGEAQRTGLAITPVRYEIAFKCGEAGGP